MTEIILVRHGQANNQATDEEGYDRLSDLGRQQARWLGAHFAATNPHFDQVITGTMRRQVDTAREMGMEITAQNPCLNELSYFALSQSAEAHHRIPAPRDAHEFAAYLPQVIDLWTRGELPEVPERFDDFCLRSSGLIDDLCKAKGRVLLVTSGGVISVLMRHALALGNEGLTKMMLQVMNSSVHRLHFVHGALTVGQFNAVPHLDAPERADARTFI